MSRIFNGAVIAAAALSLLQGCKRDSDLKPAAPRVVNASATAALPELVIAQDRALELNMEVYGARLPDALRDSLRAADGPPLVLKIEGFEVNRPVLFRVFLNAPKLTGETPLEDPHFVGMFAAGENTAPFDARLELGPGLREIAAGNEQVSVGLIAIDKEGKDPGDFQAKFKSITIGPAKSAAR